MLVSDSFHVCTIAGARARFVKAAMLSRALRPAGADEVLVRTDQHYDAEMGRYAVLDRHVR